MKYSLKNLLTDTLVFTTVLTVAFTASARTINPPSPYQNLRPGGKKGPVPGRFIVKLADRVSPSAISQSLGQAERFRPVSKIALRDDLEGASEWAKYYILTSPDSTVSADELVDRFGRENVEYIEQDHYVELYDFPADQLFSHQWYLYNTGQEYYGVERRDGFFNDSLVLKSGIAGSDINIAPFYQFAPPGTTKVVVAVIDTGVDMLHPELEGRIWKNPDEIPRNGIDDDHNGFVDDTVGYDVSGDIDDILNIVPDNDPTDFHGHGTHIAGTIAATANAVGVAGIAPWVEIMPVKTQPVATNSVSAAGVLYAVNAGARICNLSWGSPFESLILKEAIDFARKNDVFLAIAAGNSGDDSPSYPASFDSSFAVAASNSSGYLTVFSTYGPQIDIVAPGQDILSLRAAGTDMYGEAGEPGVHIIDGVPGDSLYYLSDGTSMAAPVVAGAAAWLLSMRPDLNLPTLEEALRMGARDMIDPLNLGDELVGPDSISGYGLLDLAESYSYLLQGGIHIAWPVRAGRYTDDVEVKIAAAGGYTGGWELSYALEGDFQNWISLASGPSVPADSLAYTFNAPDINGNITLRLTDDFGDHTMIPFTYVRQDKLEITGPTIGEEMKYAVPMIGSIHGPGYDSLSIYYRNGGSPAHIATVTREFFDSEIYTWNISGVEPGMYTLDFYGYFGLDVRDTSISIDILSSYTAGWPQVLPGRGALTAVCSDMNKDGIKEIIVGTVSGLSAYTADGVSLEGFPLFPDVDMRGVPAIYDVDRDGEDEIICTNEFGLHVFNYDGTYADGWPQACPTGLLSSGYPQPTVTRLGADQDSAIVFVNANGRLLAYEFNGDSYFYSLEGYYGEFGPEDVNSLYYSGNATSSADLTGDGFIEVAVSYTGNYPHSGLGLLEGRTGQPAFDQPEPQIVVASFVHGTVLADLNGDDLPEIIFNGFDGQGIPTISVKTLATEDLEGWPVSVPEAQDWIGSYPTAADLDLDGIPEILFTYFGFDIASLFIFRADGSPYVQREGRPAGEAFFAPVSFGVPIVANLVDDQYPEIIVRSGYLLPGTGPERVYLLDYTGTPVPGWPISTTTRPSTVFSTPFAPLVDDIDGDDKVELVLIGEANDVFVWDFAAPYNNGQNSARLFNDNRNSSIYKLPLPASSQAGKAVAR